MPYHELSSEKYWLESTENERQQLLKQNRRRIVREFACTSFALVVVTGLVAAAIQTMPNWLPSLVLQLKLWGIV